MEAVLSYAIESLFCGGLFYLLFRLLISEKSSYNFQRGYLMLSSLFTVVFPLIKIPLIEIDGFSSILPEITIGANRLTSANSAPSVWESGHNYLSIFYFSLMSLFALIFFFQIIKIWFIFFNGTRQTRERIVIISSNMVKSPFSFFKLIFLNNISDNKELECVLSHEIAHIKKRHSLDILCMSVIKVIQWFNPFIYYLNNALVSVHEYQADKYVIKSGCPVDFYQNLMLRTQFGLTPFIANSLNNSLTIKRLKQMENLNENKNRVITILSVVVAASALFFVVSCNNSAKKSETPENKTAIQQAAVDSSVVKAPEEVPFQIVEKKPQFQGGDETAFTKWVFSEYKTDRS